jgi:lipopolysaccharide export system protein LptA
MNTTTQHNRFLSAFRVAHLRKELSSLLVLLVAAGGPLAAAESPSNLLDKPLLRGAEKDGLGKRDSVAKPSLEKSPKTAKAPNSGSSSQKPEGATEITAQKRLVFDPKESKAIFTGDVVVVDPRFNLNCEILTAFIKKSEPKIQPQNTTKEELAPAKAEPPASSKSPSLTPKNSGGLEKAIAEGDVVIVQERVNEQGEVERSIGRAQKAVYESTTDTISLYGWPRVDQEHKRNSIVSTAADTVMTMSKKGDVDIQGPMKAVFWNSSSASR